MIRIPRPRRARRGWPGPGSGHLRPAERPSGAAPRRKAPPSGSRRRESRHWSPARAPSPLRRRLRRRAVPRTRPTSSFSGSDCSASEARSSVATEPSSPLARKAMSMMRIRPWSTRSTRRGAASPRRLAVGPLDDQVVDRPHLFKLVCAHALSLPFSVLSFDDPRTLVGSLERTPHATDGVGLPFLIDSTPKEGRRISNDPHGAGIITTALRRSAAGDRRPAAKRRQRRAQADRPRRGREGMALDGGGARHGPDGRLPAPGLLLRHSEPRPRQRRGRRPRPSHAGQARRLGGQAATGRSRGAAGRGPRAEELRRRGRRVAGWIRLLRLLQGRAGLRRGQAGDHRGREDLGAVQQASACVLRRTRAGGDRSRRPLGPRTGAGAEAQVLAGGLRAPAGRRAVALSGRLRIVELSTKCKPGEAFQVAAETRAFLAERGVDLLGEQQTKTRTALEYFAGQLRK